MDVSCKQLTVDFVNQSVAHAGAPDPESRRSDKTDFAERLGAMNRRWQILQGRLSEQVSPPVVVPRWTEAEADLDPPLQIQLLENLLDMWLQYESSVQALKLWMTSQEERLRRRPRLEDLTSVQNALKDCQVGPPAPRGSSPLLTAPRR